MQTNSVQSSMFDRKMEDVYRVVDDQAPTPGMIHGSCEEAAIQFVEVKHCHVDERDKDTYACLHDVGGRVCQRGRRVHI